jgi:hypothetical protein
VHEKSDAITHYFRQLAATVKNSKQNTPVNNIFKKNRTAKSLASKGLARHLRSQSVNNFMLPCIFYSYKFVYIHGQDL